MATNNQINVPSNTIALAGANGNITSMTGLTGAIKAPVSVQSAANENVLQFGYTTTSVNWIEIFNAPTNDSPEIRVVGTDSSISLLIGSKNGYVTIYDSTNTTSGVLRFLNAAGSKFTSLSVNPAQGTNAAFILPALDGTSGQFMKTDGSGNLSFANATGAGTVNSGTGGQLAYYATSGTTISSLSAVSYPIAPGWTGYTPVITLVGGTGNVVPTFSNATGTYTQIGNTVFVDFTLSNSSGGTAGGGSGQVNISLPITANASQAQGSQLCGIILNGAAAYSLVIEVLSGGNTTGQIAFLTGTSFQGAEGATLNDANIREITGKFFYSI